MSLRLNSSGGGSVTLQEPATASALTLNLPAVNGTVVTNTSPGTVLQVVQTIKSDTSVLNSTSFVDVPGMSVTITPQSTSNRVMVQFTIHVSYINMGTIQLVRGSTVIGSPAAASNRIVGMVGSLNNGGDNNAVYGWSMTYVDSPASTTAQTYKLQFRGETTGNFCVNRSVNDLDTAAGTRTISTITVMEIAG